MANPINGMESTVQRRCLLPELAEMRLAFEKNGPRITGYAAVFNQLTELWPGFREKVAPGAFAETIQRDDIRALWNHNPDVILGRNKAETLRLWEDAKGLAYEIIADPDDPDAQKLIRKIKRGDISQSSFGFQILKKTIEIDETKDEMTRTIEKVQLFDVSPVTFPAYPQTEGLHVRMTRNDKECIYFVGDQVIEAVPIQKVVVQPPSDEELSRRFADLKKRIYGP